MNSDYIKFLLEKYNSTKINFWDTIAEKNYLNKRTKKFYRKLISKIYKLLIPEGYKILELGCGEGDLLNALKPSYGVGVDFSNKMIEKAKAKHPNLHFFVYDVHDIPLEDKFDYIILSDLINDVFDVQLLFRNLRKFCSESTRIVFNFYSHLWELPLNISSKLKLRIEYKEQNWLTVDDLENILKLENYEIVNRRSEILFPFNIPLLSQFLNKFLVKLWPFNLLSLSKFLVVRLNVKMLENKSSVSVIIPARNEEGHIEEIFKRVPEMGSFTELIFVEGNSTDNTYQKIEECIRKHPDKKCFLYKQTGKGKGDAVRLGFEKASGDILMILDADITVPPEYLPRFYDAIENNYGEFINGVRLVYPMEEKAMRFFNLLGNKFFSLAFSWLLSQKIKDTLCGTKVLRKKDYEKIAANRSYFGDFDPFGDFDLLFGAAKLNLKIVDLPIRYGQRVYGTTNIQRWKHGWLLLKMVLFSAKKLKFI